MSISKKIFICLLAAFFAAFLLIVLVQTFFFGKYYAYLTEKNAMETAEYFAEEYISWNDDEEVNDGIVKYSDNNMHVMVMGRNGNILHMITYEMRMQDENGNEIRVALDDASRSKQFQNMNLKEGDFVTIGYHGFENSERVGFCVPDRIESNGKVWETAPERLGETEFERRFISGVVVSAAFPKAQNGFAMQRHESVSAARSWSFQNHNKEIPKDGEVYYYTDGETENQYMVAVKGVIKNGENEIVIAVSSMNAVNHAVGILKRMSGMWVFIAVFAGIVTAFVLMRVVSKPVLNITNITKKMSCLDFSEKCNVKNEDEIGILAQNINEMSEKLDEAIKNLKAANERLKLDIEHEKLLEEQRKEFVAAVSHELKTPLAVIQAYTEGILDGISGKNRVKYLNVILDETKRMDSLVLEMLENSRLEAGAEKPEFKEHDMVEFAESVAKRFEMEIMSEEIEFFYEIQEKPIIKKFDLNLIERVADNFMRNALLHTDRKGYIKLKLSESIFSVENSGKHIREEDIEKVWDKFYKVDKSRTRSGSGTGLGLSIARNILNLHNAEYGVKNTENGVEFWFKL